MTLLVFTVCVAMQCDVIRVPVSATPLQCRMAAPMAMATLARHLLPGERIETWRCEVQAAPHRRGSQRPTP